MLQQLADVVGDQYLQTDKDACVFYAQDVYTRSRPALAVVSPADSAELSAVVRAITGAGHPVIARGGGMSYTSGYVPRDEGSVIVDTGRMNRVLEINRDDMYVTVEAGCTWKDLHAALEGSGLRTPYWGTLSGLHATVGGGVSQNSIFWGSGKHGTMADSLVSMDVVLADGSIVSTGSNARRDGTPFFRHYGPDLTGVFACDTGALGIKATVTLRLIPVREAWEGMAFDFPDHRSIVRAMSEISRRGLADECFGFDPNLQSVRMQRESLASDVKKFAGVLKSAGSVMGALKDGAKVALAGRGFMKDVKFSLQVMIEDHTRAAVSHAADQVRALCESEGATEIENSIPKILRANPFSPLNNMIGPNGERWVPVHVILPHSKALPTYDAVMSLFDRYAGLMEQHGIGFGFLLTTVAHNGFVIEPVFFTPDELNELHKATVEPSVLKRIAGFPANPEAQAATAAIRAELIDVFRNAGGVHMQIGKSYPYFESLRPEARALIDAIKKTVDPRGLMNPGSLGLG